MLIVGTLMADRLRPDPPRDLGRVRRARLLRAAAALHVHGLNENGWVFAVALLAVGLSIFVFGMLIHRFGEAWGQRFVRRPPPNIAASP